MAGFKHAYTQGNEADVRRLIPGASFQQKVQGLSSAVVNGRVEIVKLLLQNGAPPNPRLVIEATQRRNAEMVEVLLEQGTAPDDKHQNGGTALTFAVRKDYAEIAKLLLDAGSPVDPVDDRNFTPLYYAVKSGYWEIALMLIEHKATADAVKEPKVWNVFLEKSLKENDVQLFNILLLAGVNMEAEQKALIKAVQERLYDIFDLLLEAQVNLNIRDNTGRTALMWATERQDVHTVKGLVSAGALVNLSDGNGFTALMIAVPTGDDSLLRYLIRHGANTEMKNLRLDTALDLSMRKYGEFGRMQDTLRHARDLKDFRNIDDSYFPIADGIVKDRAEWERVNSAMVAEQMSYEEGFNTLLEGFDVNKVDEFKRSLLMYSSYYGHLGIVLMLLNKKADTKTQDSEGMNALTWAVNGGRADIVQMLIAYECPVDSVDRLNRNALHHALRGRDYPIATVLMNMKSKLECTDQLNGALVWASKNNYKYILSLLLKTGVHPAESDELGISALMHATKEGFTECVKELIKWGTHINSVDAGGRTALYYAMVNSRTEIMKMLLENDANIAAVSSEDTALSLAIKMPSISAVRDILKSVQNEPYSWMKCEGAHALILSLRKKCWEISRALIEAADTDIKNEDARQENPLVVAFEMECPLDVIGFLIAQGTDMEGKNADGETPLLVACRTGNYGGVSILLRNGANPQAKNVLNDINMTKEREKIVATLTKWKDKVNVTRKSLVSFLRK